MTGNKRERLTDAFVGLVCRGPAPRPVEVEGLALLAVPSRRVVLAVARQLPLPVMHAPRSVAVALAPTPDREVRHGVEERPGRAQRRRRRRSLVGEVVLSLVRQQTGEPVEHDLDVCGGHPVLEHGRVVEVVGGRAALQGAERDAGHGPRVGAGVRAQGLLLVGLGDGHPGGSPVHPPALTGVELEGVPGLAEVHGLVERQRIGFGRVAELQRDVGQLVLLSQRQGERDVVQGVREGLAHPAGQVVGVVEVGQVVRGVSPLRVGGVADLAAGRRSRRRAVSCGRGSARA